MPGILLYVSFGVSYPHARKFMEYASAQTVLKQPSLLLWLPAQTSDLFLLKSHITDPWKIHVLISDSWIEVYMSFLGRKCFRVRRKCVIQLKEFLIWLEYKKIGKKRISGFYNPSKFVSPYHLILASITQLKSQLNNN